MSKATERQQAAGPQTAGPVQAHMIGIHVCDEVGCVCGNSDVRFTLYDANQKPIAYGFLTEADARDVIDRLVLKLGRPAGVPVQ